MLARLLSRCHSALRDNFLGVFVKCPGLGQGFYRLLKLRVFFEIDQALGEQRAHLAGAKDDVTCRDHRGLLT